MSDWVTCPICGSPDMRRTTDRESNALIHCVNHACASNGGTNADAITAPLKAALEPLAALADAYDNELRSRGIRIPSVHNGDDSGVAMPPDWIIPYLRKRPQPYYLTMRDAVAARKAIES